jgi:hypothetical protein
MPVRTADLEPFADLELSVRSDRAADGSEDRPFFLELRLGSKALAIGAGGNDWHRLIQVDAPSRPAPWHPGGDPGSVPCPAARRPASNR